MGRYKHKLYDRERLLATLWQIFRRRYGIHLQLARECGPLGTFAQMACKKANFSPTTPYENLTLNVEE